MTDAYGDQVRPGFRTSAGTQNQVPRDRRWL